MGQNDVRLTRLSEGEQTIEVKATNAEGQWGKEVFTLTVHCKGYWWTSVWAYVFYALVFLCLLVACFWLGKKVKLKGIPFFE